MLAIVTLLPALYLLVTSFTPLNAEKSTALKAAGEGHITEKGDAQEGPECKKK